MKNLKGKAIILYDSDEAATHMTHLEGWVSGDGRYFGKEEHLARWSGCTHLKCECGEIFPKGYTICKKCRDKKEDKKYEDMKKKVWDKKTPLYSLSEDEYFFNDDEVDDYAHDHDCYYKDLQLIICEPVELRQLDTDFFCDCLADDQEITQELEDAIDEFNAIVGDHEPLSWRPGKYACIILN